MADNFRIKYTFEGKEYSSGVSDVFRNKTEFHIFVPVELRKTDTKMPQFLTVTIQDKDYTSNANNPLSRAMFNGFLNYMDKHPI